MKKSVQTVVIICVTNNINRNPHDICHGFIAISSILKKLSNNSNIFICEILPCGEFFSVNILIISEIINLLKFKCFVTNFHYKSWMDIEKWLIGFFVISWKFHVKRRRNNFKKQQ